MIYWPALSWDQFVIASVQVRVQSCLPQSDPSKPSVCSGKVLENVVEKRAGTVTYRGHQRRINSTSARWKNSAVVPPWTITLIVFLLGTIIAESLDLINTEFKRLKNEFQKLSAWKLLWWGETSGRSCRHCDLEAGGFVSQPFSLHFNHAQFGCDGLCVLRLPVMRGFIC